MVNKSIIALDVGSRRVGVALANTVARLANPLTTIDRKTSDVWTLLGKIIDENKVDIIVIGLPRGMSGQETEQTALVRQFAEDFKSKFNLDYNFQDEAVTSVMAEEELQARGGSYTKGDIDSLSATYILNDFITENYQQETR